MMNLSDPFKSELLDKLTLYHAMRNPIEGDFLKTSHERTVNEKTGTYIFATPYLAKALMFAFNWREGEAIVGGPVDHSIEQYIILCNRKETLARDRQLYIYSLQGKDSGFVKALSGSPYFKDKNGNYNDTREFCTLDPFPVSKMTLYDTISEVSELMRRGLQIFSFEETYDELVADGFLERREARVTPELWLESLLNEGMIWENYECQINPDKKWLGLWKA